MFFYTKNQKQGEFRRKVTLAFYGCDIACYVFISEFYPGLRFTNPGLFTFESYGLRTREGQGSSILITRYEPRAA